MSSNKNTALEVPTTSKTATESAKRSNTTQSTLHGRKVTFHMIVNPDDVRSGHEDVFRTLCGRHLPLPKAIHRRSKSAVTATPNHTFCQACQDLYDLEQELGL
jgi:hypothetical protein